MHYVYVLKREGKWYIGYTANLVQRLSQHEKKYKTQLLYYESYINEKSARTREARLKYYGSAWRSLKKRIEGGV